MNIHQRILRVSFARAPVLQRFATTEATKKPNRNAAPPVPKAMKSPSSRNSVSAYSLFIQQLAAERKKSGEKFLLTDAAKAYKSLPESEKSKLLEQIPALVSQRKAIYDEFVSKLSPSEILAENKTRADLRKKRMAAGKSVKNLSPILDKNAPTRPLGAFFLWAQQARQATEYQGMSITEQAKAMGEKWKSMAENEKAEWNTRAKSLREEYEQKKAEYYGSS